MCRCAWAHSLCSFENIEVYARNRHASLVLDQCLEALSGERAEELKEERDAVTWDQKSSKTVVHRLDSVDFLVFSAEYFSSFRLKFWVHD